MTQAQTAADAAQRPDPVEGVTEAAEEVLGSLAFDTEELTEGGLNDISVTVIGFDYREGGETIKRDDGSEFISRDQLLMHLRVENAEDLGLEEPHTIQYFTLPKKITKNGATQRGKPTRMSNYGIWLSVLSSLGVSANPEEAHVYRIKGGLNDLIGLQFHRKREEFESFNGQSQGVHVPYEIYGFDNDVRKENGLEEASLAQ